MKNLTTVVALMFVVCVSRVSPAMAEGHDLSPLAKANLGLGVIHFGLSVYDAELTRRVVHQGKGREGNPLYVPFVEAHGIDHVMAVKVGVNAAEVGGLWYLQHRWPTHKREIFVALATGIVVQGVVDYHNAKVLRGPR